MQIYRLRQAQNHKVSSTEMHVKRFKRASKVSFAMSSSFQSPLPIALFTQHPCKVNLVYCVSSYGSLMDYARCIPTALWNESRTGLFIVCLLCRATSRGKC